MGYDPDESRDKSGRWTLNSKTSDGENVALSLPRIMHHITTPDRAEQIHREGLKSGSLQTSNLSHNVSKNGVYLSSDWKAMTDDPVALGDITGKHDKLHVISVDVGGMLGNHNAKSDDEFAHDDPAQPIVASTHIPPQRIRDSFQIENKSKVRGAPRFERIKSMTPDVMSESEKAFFLKQQKSKD